MNKFKTLNTHILNRLQGLQIILLILVTSILSINYVKAENVVEESVGEQQDEPLVIPEETPSEISEPAKEPASTVDEVPEIIEEEQPNEIPDPTELEDTEDPIPTVEEIPEIIMKTISQEQIDQAVNKLLAYLKSQQSEDGKIMDGTITDWAIISFGANGQYADEIKNGTSSLLDYKKKYNLDDPSDINSCATYPRHVLALLAAGVEHTDPAITGLKEKMNTICYTNNMYGLNGINDDVFALLALSALDTNQSEPIIQDIVSTTLAWQMENGAFSWPDWVDPNQKIAGDDITGAAINALTYAKSKGSSISDDVFTKAKDYLKTTQQTDGGWGYGSSDIMTTSWVLMGINALQESQQDWFVTSTGKNPWHPLAYNLKPEGFYESAYTTTPGTVDWFAMKHAVPALLQTSWPIILTPKVTNFSDGATFTYGGGGGSSVPTPTTTSDIATPTTTLQIPEILTPSSTPTSVPELIETSTSTPTTTLEIIKEIKEIPEEIIVPNIKPKMVLGTRVAQPQKKEIIEIKQETEDTTSTTVGNILIPEKISEEPTPSPLFTKKLILGAGIPLAGLLLFLGLKLFKIMV